MASAPGSVYVDVKPNLSPAFVALAEVAGDVVEKVDAGAALVYALYHLPVEEVLALPASLRDAIVRAQEAYGVGPEKKFTVQRISLEEHLAHERKNG